MDEDAALQEEIFDTIVIGTGLIESIVASAIAKAGRKVLHLEKYDYYGKHLASFSLTDLIDFCNEASSMCENILNGYPSGSKSDENVIGNPFELKVTDWSKVDRSCTKALRSASRSPKLDHPSCFGYLLERNSMLTYEKEDCTAIHPSFFGYDTKSRTMSIARALHLSRKFSIDLSFQLTFSAGNLVETMINSGVSKYLEFRCVDCILIHDGLAPGTAPVVVPCSKGDVFKTKMLSTIEKRSLMKLLQFALDWGRAGDGQQLETLNERGLSQGSSLRRPQNKAVLAPMEASSAATESHSLGIVGFEYAPFSAFLATRFGLSPKLQSLIVHALCFDPSPTNPPPLIPGSLQSLNTPSGLRALYRHMLAIGQYGGTALLAPLYGLGEVPQAFCRTCAVWGGVYVLRCCVQELELGPQWPAEVPQPQPLDHQPAAPKSSEAGPDAEPEVEAAAATAEEAGTRPGEAGAPSVSASTTAPQSSTTTTTTLSTVVDTSGRRFRCRNVVCNISDLPQSFLNSTGIPRFAEFDSGFHLVRRASVVSYAVLPAALSLLVIPPLTLSPKRDNPYAVYVVQVDPALQVTPTGTYLLYVSTVVPKDHQQPNCLLADVMSYLQTINAFTEIFFVNTSRLLAKLPINMRDITTTWPGNLHIVGYSSPQELEMSSIADEARRIFTCIYPDLQYLPPADSTNDGSAGAEFGDEEDLTI